MMLFAYITIYLLLSHIHITCTSRAFEVDMDKLCKGNNDTKFRIECWDEDTLEDNHNLISGYVILHLF